jgi:hypothetical protein
MEYIVVVIFVHNNTRKVYTHKTSHEKQKSTTLRNLFWCSEYEHLQIFTHVNFFSLHGYLGSAFRLNRFIYLPPSY